MLKQISFHSSARWQTSLPRYSSTCQAKKLKNLTHLDKQIKSLTSSLSPTFLNLVRNQPNNWGMKIQVKMVFKSYYQTSFLSAQKNIVSHSFATYLWISEQLLHYFAYMFYLRIVENLNYSSHSKFSKSQLSCPTVHLLDLYLVPLVTTQTTYVFN